MTFDFLCQEQTWSSRTHFATMLHKDNPVGLSMVSSNGFYADFCVRADRDFCDNVEDLISMHNRESPYGGEDPPSWFPWVRPAVNLNTTFAWSNEAERCEFRSLWSNGSLGSERINPAPL
eukprot:Gregarina_sp_Poly_1__5256@NODE_2787_length_1718_cov_41_443973_g1755_i0_p1_GENE_NODE_2787_length_1718_cov_41_443973_g1755_i0NODE_2787_length_1718_cov_41_443973_g1755_i0_p1_ORF_typecomplete_len120_score8_23_NODE_2787_length_1718_cov_41_443973_g1755_i06491008